MPRVFGSISEDLLRRFESDCAAKSIKTSEGLKLAIEQYLNGNSQNGSEELEHLRTALDQQGQKIVHYKELLAAKDGEILHLRELSNLLTSKIIPALPVSSTPLPETPKKPWYKFW